MGRGSENGINKILKINNKIIRIKSNEPSNFLRMRDTQSKLSKVISDILGDYISGPSIPDI